MAQPFQPKGQAERRTIALGVLALGVYNLMLAILPRSVTRLTELDDVVPREAIHGSHFGLVVLGMLFILTARGLWHGKHAAWLIALVAASASAGLHLVKNIEVPGALFSLVLTGALFGARQQFPARLDPPTARQGLAILLLGVAAAFVYSVIGLYFLDADFRHQISFGLALRDSFRLLFLLPSTQAEPDTRHGAAFIDSVRVAFLTAFAFGLIQMLRPVLYRARTTPRERERVEQLIRDHADSALAFFALLPDKSYFFSAGGNAVLAYRVAGNTAVVMGDPLGEEADFDQLIASFHQECDLNGWAYGFSQARPRYLPLYGRHGLKAMKIGEEAVVDVGSFNLHGTRMKHLRAAVNRLERDGYQARVSHPPHRSSLILALRRVSEAWLAQGNRRERTFTLGYFDEAILQRCAVMSVIDRSGEIAGFANIVPSYRSTDGNFDMVRYVAEPKGLADYLYVSLIRYFQAQGLRGMNLGLAPFSGLQDRGRGSPATTAMRLLYRHTGFLLRYKGLRVFKEKFQPAWEPRYLIYPAEPQLAGLALAILAVGEIERKKPHNPPARPPKGRTPLPMPSG